MKSKHPFEVYLEWMKNFFILNSSIVFFTNNRFMKQVKELRPKNLLNKTKFIELEMEDFYSYKTFLDEFNKTFEIDRENRYHTIPLYLIWAEKCTFLKKAITKNYFNSSCFYWIDSGYFRKPKEMKRYINNWPSDKRCNEDPRVLFNLLRNFTEEEIKGILSFDEKSHNYLQTHINVAGGMFGGKPENIFKFSDLYYNSIRLFYKNNIYIVKDQNIFTFIAFSHPDIVKLVFSSRNYYFFKKYLSSSENQY